MPFNFGQVKWPVIENVTWDDSIITTVLHICWLFKCRFLFQCMSRLQCNSDILIITHESDFFKNEIADSDQHGFHCLQSECYSRFISWAGHDECTSVSPSVSVITLFPAGTRRIIPRCTHNFLVSFTQRKRLRNHKFTDRCLNHNTWCNITFINQNNRVNVTRLD